MNPYTPLSTPRRTALTVAMLAAASIAPVANLDSDVATFQVVDGTMLVLLHDQPVRMYLQARYEKGRVASAAGAAITERHQVNADGRQMLRTARAGRTFPSLYHPDVIAYTRTGPSGAWTPARVMNANFEAGWVDVETPPNASATRIYYVFGDGEVALRVSRPFGSSSGIIQLWRGSARSLHETDQTDRDTAPYLVRDPKPVPQGFRVILTVRAASAVYFDGLAKHEVMLPVSETAIQATDKVALAELAERQLKGV